MPTRRESAASEYGGLAKALHWLILGLLIVQFAIAWAMPDVRRDTQPVGLIGLHLSFGATIMLVAVLRLCWRLSHPVPLLVEGIPGWQLWAARLNHGALYLLLFAVPLLGWANASARGWKIAIFGLFEMPHIWPAGSAFGRGELGDIHAWCAWVLLWLVGLHVAAALYHWLWRRDRVIWRMLPFKEPAVRSGRPPPAA